MNRYSSLARIPEKQWAYCFYQKNPPDTYNNDLHNPALDNCYSIWDNYQGVATGGRVTLRIS